MGPRWRPSHRWGGWRTREVDPPEADRRASIRGPRPAPTPVVPNRDAGPQESGRRSAGARLRRRSARAPFPPAGGARARRGGVGRPSGRRRSPASGGDPVRGAVRGPGDRAGARPVGMAAGRSARRVPTLRRPRDAVRRRPPRGRPAERRRSAGARRGGRGDRLRRHGGRPAGGQRRARRRPADDVRAGPATGRRGPAGRPRRTAGPPGRRPRRLPGRGVPALGAAPRGHLPGPAGTAAPAAGAAAAVGCGGGPGRGPLRRCRRAWCAGAGRPWCAADRSGSRSPRAPGRSPTA
jgi:hypothetical protein